VRKSVRIEGGGPAACAAIFGLCRSGFAIDLSVPTEDFTAPPLVLNEGTVQLLGELCGRSQLFAAAHELRRRVVAWGEAAPTVIAEPALSISGAHFREGLLRIAIDGLGASRGGGRTTPPAPPAESTGQAWTLCASAAAAPAGSRVERFGARAMLFAEVGLSDAANADCCWIEAGAEGWVFLAPLGARRAVVQAALPADPRGDAAMVLAGILGSTRHIARLIADFETVVHSHPIAPAIRHPLVGDGWLAVGSTAMALDPICGDGTGQALRSGVLAAALVAAAEEGGDRRALVAHFERRLLRSFGAHLAACTRLYQATLFGSRWQREIAEGAAATATFSAAANAPLEFSLNNLKLAPA